MSSDIFERGLLEDVEFYSLIWRCEQVYFLLLLFLLLLLIHNLEETDI